MPKPDTQSERLVRECAPAPDCGDTKYMWTRTSPEVALEEFGQRLPHRLIRGGASELSNQSPFAHFAICELRRYDPFGTKGRKISVHQKRKGRKKGSGVTNGDLLRKTTGMS